MINNKQVIEKLELLMKYAIIYIDATDLKYDNKEVWNNIDKIIRVNEYIDSLKNKSPQDMENKPNDE
jgi:hypothetical protein